MKSSSVYARTAAVAVIALAAAGTASVAQARSNVYFSVGANVVPGMAVGVSNAPMYYPPVTYVQPAPVYYAQPAPVYAPQGYYGYGYAPSVVTYAAPVYYRPRGHHHRHHGWR